MKIVLAITFSLLSIAAEPKKKKLVPRKPTYMCSVFLPGNESNSSKIQVHYKYSDDSNVTKTTFFKNNEFSATFSIPDTPKNSESSFILVVNNKELYRTGFYRDANPADFKVFQPEYTISCATY